MVSLSPETFLAACEMVFGHLRLKESDRWSPHICQLKYRSFVTEFPEVGDAQFLWAAERWVQSLDAGFHRYPTWNELMRFLYRCEAGIPNRSWGPREDLPAYVRFTSAQVAMMPGQPRPVAALPAAHAEEQEAYRPAPVGARGCRVPVGQGIAPGLTDDAWERYLDRVWRGDMAP